MKGSQALGIEPGAYARVLQVHAQDNRVTVTSHRGERVTYDPRRLQGVTLYREADRAFAVPRRCTPGAPQLFTGGLPVRIQPEEPPPKYLPCNGFQMEPFSLSNFLGSSLAGQARNSRMILIADPRKGRAVQRPTKPLATPMSTRVTISRTLSPGLGGTDDQRGSKTHSSRPSLASASGHTPDSRTRRYSDRSA